VRPCPPLCLLLTLALSTAACRDIERFDTKEGEAYCGSIVTAPFVFEGFPPDLSLRLRIDTDSLSSVPGVITTDDVEGSCAPSPLFSEAELRVAPDVLHDPLSTLQFGQGRELNLIAWVRSSCAGPMLAVVSLMKNDDVELRLLRPPAEPAAQEEQPVGGFALFRLSRQEGTCGF
jgi:hypothetical protein